MLFYRFPTALYVLQGLRECDAGAGFSGHKIRVRHLVKHVAEKIAVSVFVVYIPFLYLSYRFQVT